MSGLIGCDVQETLLLVLFSVPGSEGSVHRASAECPCDISDCRDTCGGCDTVTSDKCRTAFALLLIRSHGQHTHTHKHTHARTLTHTYTHTHSHTHTHTHTPQIILPSLPLCSYSNGSDIPPPVSHWPHYCPLQSTCLSSLLVPSPRPHQHHWCDTHGTGTGSCSRAHGRFL